MVCKIVKDAMFLAMKSEPAKDCPEDRKVVQDLCDTLKAHGSVCVGMAANMIGVRKQIIAVTMGFFQVPMINPVIVEREDPYETEEGCLSLTGVRPTKRYRKITVEYLDRDFKPRRDTFSDRVAQIIQHEYDHTRGIVI
ncbi:MAG: peptide deformylase [Lachnospiraceae bacterium]|nr:peptide deformylase [Lachnospiraceae bacterium]